MKCTSGCPTPGEHDSWGSCLKAKGLRVAYCNSAGGMDATSQKKWDARLDSYAEAKAQGINPQGTKTGQIQQATELSQRVGKPFGTPSYETAVKEKIINGD